ncbi:MAG: flagellar biosynthesis anti-sigma factor FlgM [Deltaproteobacteria bacterium]|nr:flagellar biosynthesis anti-sigma factor FlgM [Deltaproteobacteria bacterium]
MMKSDGRGSSSKGKKNKTGMAVIGKSASAAVKRPPAAGIVIVKGSNPLRGLSPFKRKLRMVKSRPHRLPDKNQLKVSRIKTAIENGLYSVDADSVAESMVERFLERFLGCSAEYNGSYAGRKQ